MKKGRASSIPYLYKGSFGQSYAYDANGNIISATDQAQNETVYAYNDNQLSKMAAPTGSQTMSTYDESTNDLLTQQSTNGTRTEYLYDTHGNVVSATL